MVCATPIFLLSEAEEVPERIAFLLISRRSQARASQLQSRAERGGRARRRRRQGCGLPNVALITRVPQESVAASLGDFP